MSKDRNEIFASMPVPKAALTLALPTVLSMLVTVLYNMADTFFVGRLNDSDQVAAVSLATPVFLLCMAMGNMFGIGGSAFIARSLGEGRKDRVKHISAFCFYGGIAVGIIMVIGYFAAMTPLLRLIGASENTEGYARSYLSWIACGAPFIIISTAFTNLARGEGAAKAAMFGMMLGTVINFILDPIFIITLGMGVSGAAIATIIGNIVSALYYIIYAMRGNTLLSVRPKDFRLTGRLAGGVFGVGLPASANNVLMSVSNIIMNKFLADYGDVPVAAMGVAMKANMLVVLLQVGIGMGVQPLIGYNYGARNFTRMKSVMKFAMLCNVILGTVITGAYLFNLRRVISVFIDDTEVIERGIPMLRALMISGPLLGVLFVFMFTFQAMGKTVPSILLSLSRQGLVFLPTLIISNKLFGLDGLIYSQPAADYFSLLLSLGMFLLMARKLEHIAKPTPDI